MELLITLIFIVIYVFQIKYFKENNISYTIPIISFSLLAIHILSAVNNNGINESTLLILEEYPILYPVYYIGYFTFAIVALLINFIPIYADKKNLNTKQLFEHYLKILTTSNSCCSRSDYWFSCLIFIAIGLACLIIKVLLENYIINSIVELIYIALIVINLIFQAKRLNDANISKFFLFSYLLVFLNDSFIFVAGLLMTIFLCFSTYKVEIPTTQLKDRNINLNEK